MSQVGRPTLYEPEHCDRVIAMGAEGMSKTQMAARFLVTRETLYEWARVHPEFSDALSRATELSMAWWENVAQEQGLTREFNAATWAKSMSARFPNDYRESSKLELTGKDGGAVKIDDSATASKLASILAAAQERKDNTELA